ncbi:MAG: hypothetical protein ACLS6Y_03045 [Streptococcus salivarius]
MAQYESYRDREYDKQSQIYFSPEEQTNDILHWLGTNGEQAIVISVEDGAGIRKEIHSFADIKEMGEINMITIPVLNRTLEITKGLTKYS